MGIIHYQTFIMSAILLNLAPGNDTIFILSKSIAQGRRAGFVSVFGISSGLIFHTSLAALGLSLIISKSIIVFNVIKFAGAAYIVFLGIKMLLDHSVVRVQSSRAVSLPNYWKIYKDGIVTNVLNPKVAIFFIAFLPQFIDTRHQQGLLPFFILGITFATTGTIWCLLLANFASMLSSKLKSDKRIAGLINKICGSVLIVLGLKVALTSKNG